MRQPSRSFLRRAALLIALASVFSVAACSGSDQSATSSTASIASTTAGSSAESGTPAGSAATPSTDAGGVPLMSVGQLGKIRVGQTKAELRATGQVGPVGPGCEAAGPNAEAAELKVPGTNEDQLAGNVQLDQGTVIGITITAGQTVEGVRAGKSYPRGVDTLKAAGYSLQPDDGTGESFGVTIGQFTKGGKPAYGLVGLPSSGKIESISTPSVVICE